MWGIVTAGWPCPADRTIRRSTANEAAIVCIDCERMSMHDPPFSPTTVGGSTTTECGSRLPTAPADPVWRHAGGSRGIGFGHSARGVRAYALGAGLIAQLTGAQLPWLVKHQQSIEQGRWSPVQADASDPALGRAGGPSAGRVFGSAQPTVVCRAKCQAARCTVRLGAEPHLARAGIPHAHSRVPPWRWTAGLGSWRGFCAPASPCPRTYVRSPHCGLSWWGRWTAEWRRWRMPPNPPPDPPPRSGVGYEVQAHGTYRRSLSS